jgi:exosortase H (IPTLxxWG-CTERM-specific)
MRTQRPGRERPEAPDAARAETRSARVRFLVAFGAAAGVLLAVYGYPYSPEGFVARRLILPYFLAYARAAGALLSSFDPAVHVDGVVVSGRFPLRIVRSCDAGEAMALLVAAVIAFPVPWRRRALGLAIGVATVFAVNVVRICSLYLVGVQRPDLFEAAHLHVWPLLLIGGALTAFLIWARWAEGVDAAPRDLA